MLIQLNKIQQIHKNTIDQLYKTDTVRQDKELKKNVTYVLKRTGALLEDMTWVEEDEEDEVLETQPDEDIVEEGMEGEKKPSELAMLA